MASSVEITLSDADIAKADTFLSTFLAENVVDGDFSPGSALPLMRSSATGYLTPS